MSNKYVLFTNSPITFPSNIFVCLFVSFSKFRNPNITRL